MRLTLAGQKFLEIARNILDEVAEGIALTKQVAAGANGKLRIGFTESTLFSLAPKIVSTYRQQYPQVELTLTSGGTETQVEALRTHQIDVGFVYLPIREPSLSIHPLFEEAYIAAIPAAHRLARQPQIAIESLATEPLIFYPRSLAPILHANFINCCDLAGFVPKIVQEAELAQTRLGLVAAGVGITFVLANLQNLTAKGVVYRPLIGDFLTLKLALAWRQNESSPVVLEGINLLKIIN